MRLKLVTTEKEGHCSVCGEPCRVRCPQHDGSRFRRPLGELWRLGLLTISGLAWCGFTIAVGWLIATGARSGLELLAVLAIILFLIGSAFHVWRIATGQASSEPAAQKIIHVHRRWL